MSRIYKIALGAFVLLIICLVWLEANEPQDLNWSPSYTSSDKIPLGGYLLAENWKHSGADIKEIEIPPYEYLNDSPEEGTYFFLNDFVVFDDDELDDILEWVNNGNRLVIVSNDISPNLADTLNLEISASYSSKDLNFESKPEVNLSNPLLKLKENQLFDHEVPSYYFSKIDTSRQTILGTVQSSELEKQANFIRAPFGKGEIYLHTTPEVFSNYFLFDAERSKYIQNLLAYFQSQNILWDAYYKTGKKFYTSPLYIFLNNKPLKWAYYFTLISAVLFIIFEGKRKQRPIPVVEPLKNRSYEYTQTIAQLFLEKKAYFKLGIKKIDLFKEFIRKQYRLDPDEKSEEFYRQLASRSDNTEDATKELFQFIENYQQQQENDKNSFQELSKKINAYKGKYGKSGNEY